MLLKYEIIYIFYEFNLIFHNFSDYKGFSYLDRNLLKKNMNKWQNSNAYEFFLSLISFYWKKLNPGIAGNFVP